MARQLVLLRHAKSSWKRSDVPDHERGLNRRGKRDAPRAGEALLQLGICPDFIVSSTARRARATAKRVARTMGYRHDRWLDPDLYLPTPEGIVEVLRKSPEQAKTVMAVGHNPGWEALAHMLLDEPVTLPTASFVVLELAIDEWDDLRTNTPSRSVARWRPGESTK